MTGAMYAAVSGMKAHMGKLNIIGNNVANVNTAGYKAATTLFAESIYTTSKAGSNGTASMGGINPVQTGYGCTIANVSLDMSTKNYMPGRTTDMMIAGDGFFMVGPKDAAQPVDPASLSLTRVGDFEFDSDGYLTDGRGNIVFGFLSARSTNTGTDLDIAGQTKNVSNQLVPIRLPMAANAPAAGGTGPKEGSALYPYTNATGADALKDNDHADSSGKRIKLNSMSIGASGEIMGVNAATGDPVVVGYVPLANVANPAGVTHMGQMYYQALGGAGEVSVASVGGVVKGNLENDPAGAPGASAILGNSGSKLIPGGLESSGTDVATEFSEMITTQRGYQANTRVITVTDAMLEELVNIKR